MIKLAVARIGAFLVDYIILAIYAVLLSIIVSTFLSGSPVIPDRDSPRAHGHLMGFVTLTLPVWLYFTLQECGPNQATIGKRLVRIRVRAKPGKTVSLRPAALRNVIKFLPWEIAHAAIWYVPGRPFIDTMPTTNLIVCIAACLTSLAYLVSLFLSDGRTPYDRVSGTYVASALTPPPSPRSTG